MARLASAAALAVLLVVIRAAVPNVTPPPPTAPPLNVLMLVVDDLRPVRAPRDHRLVKNVLLNQEYWEPGGGRVTLSELLSVWMSCLSHQGWWSRWTARQAWDQACHGIRRRVESCAHFALLCYE